MYFNNQQYILFAAKITHCIIYSIVIYSTVPTIEFKKLKCLTVLSKL